MTVITSAADPSLYPASSLNRAGVNAPLRHQEGDPVELAFASWTRILETAPIENRPRLLAMMARDARAWADNQRLQAMRDLYYVAVQLGLVKLLGASHVRAVIIEAFGGAA